MNKATAVAITVILLTLNASALQRSSSSTGIDGKWESTQTTPRGELKVTLDLKSEDGTLRGTVTGPAGQPQEIKNGKIDHDKVRFETNALVNGEQLTILWSGTLSGDALDLSRSVAGREHFQFGPLEARRVPQRR